MKHFYTLLLILSSMSLFFAQTFPLDFSDTNDVFTGFNGTSVSIQPSPTDAANLTAEFVGGSDTWDGAAITLTNYIKMDDDATNSITFDMYVAPTSSHSHLLKLEGSATGTTEQFFTTSGSGWQTVTVDFPAGLAADYTTMVIFTDATAGGGNTASGTYYFDNINGPMGGVIPVDSAPTVDAPTPTQPASNVISVYSGITETTSVYTDIPGTNLNPGWGQSTAFSFYTPVSDRAIKLAGLNYQGIQFGAVTDVSAMNTLHIDYYSTNSTAFRIFIINSAGSGNPLGAQEYFKELTVPTSSTGWNSVDIPLSDFTDNNPGIDLALIDQIKFDGNGTIYYDNLFFFNNTLAVDDVNTFENNFKAYPNPVRKGSTISLSETVKTATLYNLNGKQISQSYNTNSVVASQEEGVYILQVTNDKGESTSQKIIVK